LILGRERRCPSFGLGSYAAIGVQPDRAPPLRGARDRDSAGLVSARAWRTGSRPVGAKGGRFKRHGGPPVQPRIGRGVIYACGSPATRVGGSQSRWRRRGVTALRPRLDRKPTNAKPQSFRLG